MKWHPSAVICAVAIAFTPAAVLGQICHGNPSLANTSALVGGSVGFFDGGNEYGGGVAFGSDLFGSVGFSYADFDDTELSLKTVSGSVGYEVAASESPVSFCPSLGMTYGFGLEIFGVDVTTLAVAPAVSLGVEAVVSETVSVVPFAQAGIVYRRVMADAGPLGDDSESETDGALVLGTSLIFNSVFAVGPSVFIPLGADDGDTVVNVGFSVAVGSR